MIGTALPSRRATKAGEFRMSVEVHSRFFVDCPRCGRRHANNDMTCRNCGKNRLAVETIAQSLRGRITHTSSFLRCLNCGTPHPHYACAGCGADVAGSLTKTISETRHKATAGVPVAQVLLVLGLVATLVYLITLTMR